MRYSLFLTLLLFISTVEAQESDDYFSQAETALEKDDFDEVLLVCRLGILEDSTDVRFYRLMAHVLMELSAYQEAFNTYSYAISILPDEAVLYSDRGNLLYAVQQFDQSIEDHTMAVNTAKTDSLKCYTLNNRATAKIGRRDYFGAYEDLKTAYGIDSTDMGVLNNLGVVCDEVGKGRETLKYLLKVIELDSTYYPAYVNVGFKYQGMGKHRLAIKYFNKVLELEPNEPLGYSNRSYSKLKSEDLKGAMTDIERSIELYSTNSYAYKIRALINIEENNMEEACNDLSTALELGYTEMYGEEVVSLQDQHCRKKKE